MIKEPYYNSTSSSSFIKPSNPKTYSFVSYDLPPTAKSQFIKAPSVSFTAKTSPIWRNRSYSVEPYYVKNKKIGTLPPAISGMYKYTFAEESEEDDCAIVSDSEDDEYVPEFNIYPPPSNHETLSRKVSDNYASRYELDTDSDDSEKEIDAYSRWMKPIDSKPSIYKCTSQPPHLVNLGEINESLLMKSNNPNILTNVRSRSLSDNLDPPRLQAKVFVYNNYDSIPHKRGFDRDDYEEVQTEPYLV
ncbi:uncharacterized protein RJT20DRAFT_55284 [Scheffersomyces xylosifermentans]|uniref:uncharacterized protein n=1 Tax=Scheffersomyces xylosifermentans TaxID=1304137 RepID=UPI00315DBDB2